MNLLVISIFLIGYCAIIFEHLIKINKAASAMVTGVLCWTAYVMVAPDYHHVTSQLIEHVGNFSGILFFLMGAMTVVELIDAHNGFDLVTDRIGVKGKRQLLWVTGLLAFFLSAILDNLTTTIVMISLLMKFSLSKDERMFFIGIVIIAANAGGAWSPIGDVTTTMLWMNGHITSTNIIKNLFLPGLICAVIPLLIVSFKIKGQLQEHTRDGVKITFGKQLRDRNLIFIFGITMLLLVPLFKSVTHLPPFMGMLLALGMLWIVTEIIHAKKNNFDKRPFSAVQALTRIDIPSVLFFLGILISISALDATGILGKLSIGLDKNIGNVTIITLLIGFLSALIDNVPLVAAAMGTYGNGAFGVDHHFWTFLSYCAGTGGSALIIGSAAGVAAMGIAQIPFFWYLRKITPIALAGYLAGAGTYLLQTVIFH